jgi:hypothetical protein
MDRFYQMLEAIRSSPHISHLIRDKIIDPYTEDDLVRNIVKYTYHPFIQYYIKLDLITKIESKGDTDLSGEDSFFEELDYVCNIHKPDLQILIKIMESKNPEALKICKYVLNKEIPDLGIATNTFSRSIPSELPLFNPQTYQGKFKGNI